MYKLQKKFNKNISKEEDLINKFLYFDLTIYVL